MLEQIKSAFLKSAVITVILSCLTACETKQIKPKITYIVSQQAQTTCQSVHKSDNLLPNLQSDLITFKVPVFLSQLANQGQSVVFLVTTNADINIFWAALNQQQDWKIADKQTVIRIQPGELNAQPMQRLNKSVYPKTVLFVSIPDAIWQKSQIKIVPILEKQDFRWQGIQTYNIKITAQGFQHPFRGIENALPNQQLPAYIKNIMDKVEPGAIYVPQRYWNNKFLAAPTSLNQDICPRSRA